MIQKELQELCDRLKKNDPTLTTLNLDYGNIGIDGANALHDALCGNRVVYKIHVHHANLGFDGTRILFDGLKGRGIKTSVSLVDDYTDEEYNTLLNLVGKSQPKKKQLGNNKGIDDKILAKVTRDKFNRTKENRESVKKND